MDFSADAGADMEGMNSGTLKEQFDHPLSRAEQIYNSVRQETNFAASGIGDALKSIFKDLLKLPKFLIKSIIWLAIISVGLVLLGMGIYWFCGSMGTAPAWVTPVFILWLMFK